MSVTIQALCQCSLSRLAAIAGAVGIREGGRIAAFPAIRSFAELLRTCPDDCGAASAVRKHAAGATGFLFLAREFSALLVEGTCSFLEGQPDDSVGPYFYLSDGVLSLMDQIEAFYAQRDKHA